MENHDMGRVVVTAIIESVGDLWDMQKGVCKPEDVHRLEVTDALVDTGSTNLAMPKRLIEQLGFTQPFSTKRATTASGEAIFGMYGPVRLTIMGRFCHTDVAEVADSCPVLIGQIPLEQLDWVIDTKNHCLIGNPAHGGEHILEMY